MRKYLLLLPVFLIMSCTTAEVPQLDWEMETVAAGFGFPEGAAVGPDGSVYFSDMDAGKIFRYDPSGDSISVWQEDSRTSNGLFITGNTMYACEASGRAVVKYNLKEGPLSRTVLADRYMDKRLGSPNDLTVINGVLYFSEFFLQSRLEGEEREIMKDRLYMLGLEDHSLDTAMFVFNMPNGVARNPGATELYVADIRDSKLYRSSMTNGSPGKFELLTDIGRAGKKGPDGLAVSDDGRIFQALFGSGELLVIGADGEIIGYLPTGPQTTNCVFAADGRTLYVTADKSLKKIIVPNP